MGAKAFNKDISGWQMFQIRDVSHGLSPPPLSMCPRSVSGPRGGITRGISEKIPGGLEHEYRPPSRWGIKTWGAVLTGWINQARGVEINIIMPAVVRADCGDNPFMIKDLSPEAPGCKLPRNSEPPSVVEASSRGPVP